MLNANTQAKRPLHDMMVLVKKWPLCCSKEKRSLAFSLGHLLKRQHLSKWQVQDQHCGGCLCREGDGKEEKQSHGIKKHGIMTIMLQHGIVEHSNVVSVER